MSAICEGHGCGEEIDDVNVESFELTGKLLCSACADDDFARRAEEEQQTREGK